MNGSMNSSSERLERQGNGYRCTGFPEPLSPDRNTTLPHPDADTSLNATIEAPENMDLTRTHSRRSFLHGRTRLRKHSIHSKNDSGVSLGERGVNNGMGEVKEEQTKESEIAGEKKFPGEIGVEKGAEPLSRDVADEPAMTTTKDEREEQGYPDREKKGVLRKIGF